MSDFIKCGVIGFPVSHSLSPTIHSYWIKQYNLSGSYEALAIEPSNLLQDVRALFAAGYVGLNVTIPHKQAILELCDEVDFAAQKIGAVNTLIHGGGRVRGTNTDADGFLNNIRQAQPGFDFAAGPALVLGAGGAARAVIHALQTVGVPRIILTNRTAETAAALAAEFGIETLPWELRDKGACNLNLLVNTTSLGMTGKPDLSFDVSGLDKSTLVNDIVYVPARTRLLQDAASHGNVVVEGLGMLLHQARPAFAHWFGVMPDVTTDLEHLLQEKLAP